MSELAALMGIHGAVNDAALEGPRLAPIVVGPLRAYHHGAPGCGAWAQEWAKRRVFDAKRTQGVMAGSIGEMSRRALTRIIRLSADDQVSVSVVIP